ncbi:MAG: hypothetical protein ACYCQK_01740 [Acidiferrobacteraceae bacterium]
MFSEGQRVNYQHGYFGQVPARVTKTTARRVFIASEDERVSDTSLTLNQAAVRLQAPYEYADYGCTDCAGTGRKWCHGPECSACGGTGLIFETVLRSSETDR